MATVDEVVAAQGLQGNVIHIEDEEHLLIPWPTHLIYADHDREHSDPLDGLYDPTVAVTLAEDLKAGKVSWEEVTPVILHLYKDEVWLGDGHHRFAAHLLANKPLIMAYAPLSVVETLQKKSS